MKVKDYDKIRDGTCQKFCLFVTQKSFSSIKLLLGGGRCGEASILSEINKKREY